MGSIATLGSVSSALNQTRSAQSLPSKTSGTSGINFTDTVVLESIPSSVHLEQLVQGNPSDFQQTLANAVRDLRQAASEASDPSEAGYLSALADKFQVEQETGILLPL